ncbi:recombination-associated protein RdgC [Iodobacter sp. CM08]|uniref:recombination-associated protein RdgC n=1 Tax=Iodobacter sp. CM08 TaxID=3085902 RepID=UPI0029818E92|nr:recombination-associated protein RdgC [Iodobacter sp. CM08]MDW5418617.1 recombination-associated protein RdgC [Iodobacter sp. CM08]
MLLKNFVPYIADKGKEYKPVRANDISDCLKRLAYSEIQPTEETKVGFVSYSDLDSIENLVTVVDPNGRILIITLRSDVKSIPEGESLKEIKRIAKERKLDIKSLPKKEIKALQKEARIKLMPTAPVKTTLHHLVFDCRECKLLVCESSVKAAEKVATIFLNSLAMLGDRAPKLVPLQLDAEIIIGCFTAWLKEKIAAQPFNLGNYAYLIDAADEDKPTAKLDHHDLTVEEVGRHLGSGKKVKEILLRYDNDITFIVTTDLVFKKVTATKNLQAMLKKESENSLMAPLSLMYIKCDMSLTELLEVINDAA